MKGLVMENTLKNKLSKIYNPLELDVLRNSFLDYNNTHYKNVSNDQQEKVDIQVDELSTLDAVKRLENYNIGTDHYVDYTIEALSDFAQIDNSTIEYNADQKFLAQLEDKKIDIDDTSEYFLNQLKECLSANMCQQYDFNELDTVNKEKIENFILTMNPVAATALTVAYDVGDRGYARDILYKIFDINQKKNQFIEDLSNKEKMVKKSSFKP